MRLHAYIAAASREIECPALEVGGLADHVHVLARLGRQAAPAEWVKEIKRISSRWIKSQNEDLANFQWQGGYAAFSVSASNVMRVRRYILEQERHHTRFDYRSELVSLLKRHGLEWEERYLWD